MIQQNSTQAKPATLPEPSWFIVDAQDLVVGRLATVLARVITGRHKVNYTPGVDMGDFVVVLNSDKVALTKDKWNTKLYRDYSGYLSGLKTRTASEVQAKHPEEILKRAVWGMTNKSTLNRKQLLKLKIYAGDTHPHAGQNPQPFPANILRKTNLKKKSS